MAKKTKLIKALKKQKYSTRVRNRCLICGRSRGFIRQFGLCRLCFRRLAHRAELPGVTKASW